MNKGEKVKVYFKMNGRYYRLFNVIQMGKDGVVDLKITDFYNNLAILSKTSNHEKGYLSEDEMNKSKFVNNLEFSYHKDGSFLRKIKDGLEPEYLNPYGKGERWTATNSINDFQPVMNIEIRRMAIYNKSYPQPILKSKERAYICENNDLFESTGTYIVILYIRNKSLPLNCYTSVQLYSDVIAELNERLDLCIFIQRHNYPDPQPYYSDVFKSMVTPYLTNSISFSSRESAKDEMKDKFDNTIFDPIFQKFLLLLSGGEFINLSEDKLQLIDQIEILYKGYEGKMPVSKPEFIKLALNYLGDKLSEYNKLDPMIKQFLLQIWNKKIEAEIQNEQKKL